MVPPDIAKRVDRLFNGQHRTEDLIHLFAWLRFQTGGRAPFVRDIGDFVAHRHERDQGFTWRIALDFCNLTTYVTMSVREPLMLTRDIYVEGCRSCLRLMKPDQVRKATKLAYKVAERRLESGLSKLSGVENLKAIYRQLPTAEEAAVIEFCSTRMIGLEGITQSELMKQMIATLARNGLTPAATDAQMTNLAAFLSKFVVTLLHGAWILNEKKARVGQLRLGQENDLVLINISLPYHGGSIASAIYRSELPLPSALSETLLHSTEEVEQLSLEVDVDGLINVIG